MITLIILIITLIILIITLIILIITLIILMITLIIIIIVCDDAARLTDNFLLFVDPQMKASYQVDLSLSGWGRQQIRGIDLRTSNMPAKVAYDLKRQTLYWHDNEFTGRNSIKRMNITGDVSDEHLLTTLAHGNRTSCSSSSLVVVVVAL